MTATLQDTVAATLRAHMAHRRQRIADLAAGIGESYDVARGLYHGEGQQKWTLNRLEAIAAWLGIPARDLLP